MRPPERILLVRTDRVGDLILSTPLMRTLRTVYPKAEIVLKAPSYCREVLDGTGLCDLITDRELDRSVPFDLAIALAPRTACLREVSRARAQSRVGYVYRSRPMVRMMAKLWLTKVVEISLDTRAEVPHEVEQLDRLARALGLPPSTIYPLEVGVERRPSDSPSGDEIVLHLGDRWLQSRWSLRDLLPTIDRMSGVGPLVLTGGPREREMIAELRSLRPDLQVLCDLSFREWAEVIAGARLLVSPDTGAVHVAAAVGTPTVVAYEAESFYHCSSQWAPWKVEYRAVVKGDPAQTCRDLMRAVEELTFHSRNCRI